MRPKENPDGGNLRGEVCGLLAVRPMVEDEETDEERDGKAPRQKVEIHDSELVTAFDFLNDDGADDKGDGYASR